MRFDSIKVKTNKVHDAVEVVLPDGYKVKIEADGWIYVTKPKGQDQESACVYHRDVF